MCRLVPANARSVPLCRSDRLPPAAARSASPPRLSAPPHQRDRVAPLYRLESRPSILPLYPLPCGLAVVWIMDCLAATIEPDRGHRLECAKDTLRHPEIVVAECDRLDATLDVSATLGASASGLPIRGFCRIKRPYKIWDKQDARPQRADVPLRACSRARTLRTPPRRENRSHLRFRNRYIGCV